MNQSASIVLNAMIIILCLFLSIVGLIGGNYFETIVAAVLAIFNVIAIVLRMRDEKKAPKDQKKDKE